MENTSQDSAKQEPGSPEYLTTHDSSFLVLEERPGASTSNPSGLSSSSSLYYSARTQRMIENRNKFSSELEFQIEYSKVTWSELDATPDEERSGETNLKYFEELRQDFHNEEMNRINPPGLRFPGFFRKMDDLWRVRKLVRKHRRRSTTLGDTW